MTIRLLVVAWLVVLAAMLVSAGYAPGWALLPGAAAVAAPAHRAAHPGA